MDLESFYANAGHRNQRTWSKNLGLMLQPNSHADFSAHPEFEEVLRLWTQGDNFRGMDLARVWSLMLNIKHVLSSRNEGALAELGVYKGNSSAVLSHYARRFGRKMYLADTFVGFDSTQIEGEAAVSDGKVAAFKDTSLELAKRVVGDYDGNRWCVGMFPDSISQEMRDDRFAFVSIDCDIYQPIAEGLRFFWPRMVPGGMIFVHDYSSGHWPGATQAVDEFRAQEKVEGILLSDLSGTYALAKPGQ